MLIGTSFVLGIFLIYQHHLKSPDALQLTLIAAAGVFLVCMILSTIYTERTAQRVDEPFIWLARIRCVIGIGLAALVGFAAAQSNANPAVIASVGILTAGAAWIAGLLLGFIFGLPQPRARSNAIEQVRQTQAGSQPVAQSPAGNPPMAQAQAGSQAITQASAGSQADAQAQKPNDQNAPESPTNLEHIADWLTKLILGAGLTQIGKIPEKLDSLANYIGQAMGEAVASADWKAYKLFALAICLFFSLCGFLFGYLWGRLFMPGTFRFDPFRPPADV